MNNEFEIRGRNTAIFIETKKGLRLEAIISTQDLEKVRDFIGSWSSSWSEGTGTYYVMGHGGLVGQPKKNISLHRYLKDDPKNYVVDHINGDTLDNRFSNLRIVSQSINNLNRKNCGVVNYKGRWEATFKFKGVKHSFGMFDTEEEARKVVDKEKDWFISVQAEKELFEYEQQLAIEELQNDDNFHLHYCGACGSGSLEKHATFNDEGYHVNSFIECSNCGAEDSVIST